MNNNLRRMTNKILDALFPFGVTCLMCGKEIVGKAHNGLCKDCANELSADVNSRANYKYAEIYYACDYKNKARAMVLGAKDGDRPELTRVMALYIAETYIRNNIGCDVIAYVPCSKKNLRKRGFDHMKKCAYFLSDEIGLPVINGLKRTGKDKDQTEVAHEERYMNVMGKFIYDGESLRGKRVLLIDDVVTSGATLTSCLAALSEANPLKTVCITFAKAVSAYEISGS